MPKKRLEYMGHIHAEDGTVHEVYREVGLMERVLVSGALAISLISLGFAALVIATICLR